jgi:chorismate mutase
MRLSSFEPLLGNGKGFFVMSESRTVMSADAAPRELARLREAIDRVDEVLVRLLNQRAKYAIEIGRMKGVLSLPIYSPEREKQVLENVEGWSEGPLDPAAMRRLFERIMDEARAVERVSAKKEE